MKAALLSLILLGVFYPLYAADEGASVQSASCFRLVGLMRIDDDAEAIVEDLDYGLRYRVRQDSLIDDFRVRRVMAQKDSSFVELERDGVQYRIHLHGGASVSERPQHRMALTIGDIESNGKLTGKGSGAIAENLNLLVMAAHEKMRRDAVTVVTFQDLVSDYEKLDPAVKEAGIFDPFMRDSSNNRTMLLTAFKNLRQVAGEDYSSLQITRESEQVQVVTGYGEVVKIDTEKFSERRFRGGCF
ncbi:hypothetical protein [Cerasicoccus fimbriatus]|uniref:hypothetical protein n=1 Tax=Cerasicoccus fimbriatus TaxID=3014554 RepID=UPI0022B43528|nr:hypothetical protein [Cerasicoccus sp. TK19100]